MKKIILIGVMLLTVAGTFTGCEDRLKSEFQDPEKHAPNPDEVIPGMLTHMLSRRFFVLDYGEWWWTWNSGIWGIPAYAQIVGRSPNPANAGVYTSWWSVLDGTGDFYERKERFNDYYLDFKNWGLMRDDIENLSGQDLDDNEMFFLAATVLKDVVGLQTVDLYGKIPYSEAFQGTKGVFFPKYDDEKEIYTTILNELADLAVRMPESFNKMSGKAKSAFEKNDIAFGGDPQKWVQYINAVRLRHAVRMSGVDEAFAKTHIAAAVQNLPKEDFLWPVTQRNENTLTGEGGGIYARAIYEQAVATLIPNIIMQRMNRDGAEYVEGEDDPRLPAIANPSRYTLEEPDRYEFVGLSMDLDAQYPYYPTNGPASLSSGQAVDNGYGITVSTFVSRPQHIAAWLRSGYSRYNIGTFAYGNIPSYMTSLAENDLFLAEVAAKGFATTGKSAADHIRDAVVHSTDMWYYVNSLTNIWQTPGMSTETAFLRKAFQPTKPSAAVIERYADKVKAEFEAVSGIEDQMEIIMQQKYIHHNILNIYELWSELRRTRHPKLEKLKVSDVLYHVLPERYGYPSTEELNNPDAYTAVRSESVPSNPVFWVPTGKKSESAYMDGWLPLKGFLPLPASNPNRPADEGGTDTPIMWKP